MFSAPPHRGPASDHFDGRRFRNLEPTGHRGFRDVVKWMASRRRGAWRRVLDVEPGPPPPRRVEGGEMRVTLVNHATVLVQADGLNVLTDPIWSERCSPVSWTGPRRFRPPGIRFEDLPPIDLVLLSHNHYDHLDVPTLRRLAAEHQPVIVTGLGNVALLEREGIGGGVELDWWQQTRVAGLRVTGVPARHFSGRGPADRDVTLWMGLVAHAPSGDVLFAGDTGMGNHFREIRERLGSPRLALLPIGAYRPEWFMRRVHMTPADALEAHRILGATTSAGMHYGTFALADDGQHEPLERLREAIAASEDPAARRFVTLEHGVGMAVPPTEAADQAAQ